MLLKIENKAITASIENILEALKKELRNNKLKDIRKKGENIVVSCPHHKNGLEHNPSCSIYCGDSPDIEYGTVHCFTCGFSGPLWHFIAECFDSDDNFGKQWLLERFGDVFVQESLILPSIDLKPVIKKQSYLDENILNCFQNYHPYMTQRKLSNDVINKFKIKYDTSAKCIVFPVWDINNNLVMLTRRSVYNKTFIIDKGVEKPVYLLNYIKKENIKTVYVCESQINALTLWSYGYPAIALFGTGAKHQYELLNKSGIRNYYLCFDGDDAGDKGTQNFIKNIRKDVLINIIKIPKGKDVNDLSLEEFQKLPII